MPDALAGAHPLLEPERVCPSIILTTLNARYIHASLGLRYLLANMECHGGKELRAQTLLREFTAARRPPEIVAELLAELGDSSPPAESTRQIVGFGVYIWNVAATTEVIRILKHARPDIAIVLGGPEVSHEWETQEIVALADHVITGWGDVSFPKLCVDLLNGTPPLTKVLAGEQPALDQIVMPYREYSAADLAQRITYVEASRGCPFKCEFCLSSLDETAWAFPLDRFLDEMDLLYRRGARQFKFVDRTFNLKLETSSHILQFFLDRIHRDQIEKLSLHFELIPDHLPEQLKGLIERFPPGVLQFEVGIQTFNPEVQHRISRRQDSTRAEQNLRWLKEQTQVHVHADLIFGLPGETLASFALGFDRLYALRPQELQLGMLKRLRGTRISRHTEEFGMRYDPFPPYSVQQTDAVDSLSVARFARLARYWDLVANSGRFASSLPMLLTGPSAFAAFLQFADWLWLTTRKTNGLSPELLVDAIFDYLTSISRLPKVATRETLLADYLASGARGQPVCLQGLLNLRQPSKAGKTTLRQHRNISA